MLGTLFRKDPVRSQAETLFAAIAEQARAPEFYQAAGAPDTPEGRFDLLALHMVLATTRLRKDAPASDRLVQLLQEAFFESLDSGLREMGVGDLSVGRKIRGLAESFYGQYRAYEQGLADEAAFDAAIARNVFGSGTGSRGHALGDYGRAAHDRLMAASVDDLAAAITGLRDLSMRLFIGGSDDAKG